MTTDSKTTSTEQAIDRRQGDRRQRRSGVHFPERRLGFDDRDDPTISPRRRGYRARVRRISESPRKSAILLGSIVVLAVADIVFTFKALDRGLEELNPVMRALLDSGHGLAAFVKVGITAALAVIGFRFRRFRRVIDVAVLVAAIMSLVFVYHLLGLIGA